MNALGKIKELELSLANKIAAGEVVERPASVVKELLENAIDAQATQIDITIKESGIQSRVVDNGTGIDEEDIGKALVGTLQVKLITIMIYSILEL